MQVAEKNDNKVKANDEMVVLFTPLTGLDYQEAKYQLESAEIPYEVKISLWGGYYMFIGRYENYSSTTLLVNKADKKRAELVCKIQMDNTELIRKKRKKNTSPIVEKIKSFLRLF